MPNLVTALAEALANAGKATVSSMPASSKRAPPEPAPAARPAALPDDILLNALRNSLTGRDLIMQRRIGFGHEEQG